MTYCPDCELKAQMARITPESVLSDVSRLGLEVTEEAFEERLSVCRECFNFQAGMMCDMNGSYSAYVARKKVPSCPRNKWK